MEKNERNLPLLAAYRREFIAFLCGAVAIGSYVFLLFVWVASNTLEEGQGIGGYIYAPTERFLVTLDLLVPLILIALFAVNQIIVKRPNNVQVNNGEQDVRNVFADDSEVSEFRHTPND